MKTRLFWILGLGLLVSMAVFAATTPINRPSKDKAAKPKDLTTVQPSTSLPAAPVGDEAIDTDVMRRIERSTELESVLEQFRAAKSAGQTPSRDVYRRLEELTPPSPRRNSGHLDQGGENCAFATVITEVPYIDAGITTGYADDLPECDGTGAGPDVAYVFTPGVTADYHISLCGSLYDTKLAVYSGTCTGAPIACNDDGACWPSSEILRITLTAGTTYYFVIDGWNGDFGDYAFYFEELPPLPQGDACEEPFVVPTLPFSVENATTCGFAHNYDGTCAFFATGPDVVYEFTLSTATSIEVLMVAHPAEGTMPEYVWPTILLSNHCPPDWDCIANAWSITAGVLYLSCNPLPAGTYYVVISSDVTYHPCFEFDLAIRSCGPCDIVSQPGDIDEVAEPFPVPGTYSINDPDGGCNNAAPFDPQYQDILGDQTIYGRTFAYTDSITGLLKADMDWYRLVVATPTSLTCTYGGESMLQVRLLTPPCPGVIVLTGSPATPCYTGTFTECLEPGEYYVRIERSGAMSGPDALPLEYRATFTLTPCELPIGRCCYAGTCANNTHPECVELAGVWFAGMTCDEPCPNIPPNDNCQNAGIPATLPATFTGNNINATNDCPLYEGDPQVWHVFTTTETQNIQVDYCGTPDFHSFNPWLYNGCPCAERTMLDVVDWGLCSPTAMTGIWWNLPAGTWYISVSWYVPNSNGPYTIHVNAVSSDPPPNDECATATPIIPVPNGSANVTGSTLSATVSCTNICAEGGFDYGSTGNDVFYSLTLTECRKIAMALGNSDMHISVYQGLNMCCTDPAFLCNDDDANFTPLPWWDVPEQHLGNSCSYVAASLEPGTYLIRVAKYASQSGAYSLTVYDNGPCHCTPPTVSDLTVYRSGDNIQVRWSTDAEQAALGTYRLYANTNDMPPADPSWTIVADDITPVVGENHLYYTTPFAGNERVFYYVTGVCDDGPPPPTEYCAVSHANCDEYIGNVTVGTINNSTPCTAGGYNDYTAISTNMTIGTNYPITVTNPMPYSPDATGVWIDWNNNFMLTDDGEYTLLNNDGTGATFTGTITPPAGSTGTHRMRIRLGWSWTPAPCGNTDWGEAEDYTITVP